MPKMTENSVWRWIVDAPEWGNLAEWFSAALGGIALILALRAVHLQKASNERSETEEKERQVSVYARNTSARPCFDSTSQQASQLFGDQKWYEHSVEIRHFGTVPATDLAVVTKVGTKQVIFHYGDVLPGETVSLIVGPVDSILGRHPFSIEFTSFAGRHYRRPFRGALELVEHRSGGEGDGHTINLHWAEGVWVLSGETDTETIEHDDGSVVQVWKSTDIAFFMRNTDSKTDEHGPTVTTLGEAKRSREDSEPAPENTDED